MSQPIAVDILSDSDSDDNRPTLPRDAIDLTTPPLSFSHSKKRQRTQINNPNSGAETVLIIDDDPTPTKPPPSRSPKFSSTPSFVAETPFSDASNVKCSNERNGVSDYTSSGIEQLVIAETPISEFSKSEVSLVKCKRAVSHCEKENSQSSNPRSSGNYQLISVDSDNESDTLGDVQGWKRKPVTSTAVELDFNSRFVESSFSLGTSADLWNNSPMANGGLMQMSEVPGLSDEETGTLEPLDETVSQRDRTKYDFSKKNKANEAAKKKRMSKEERLQLMAERKRLKEEEKLQKAALKAEAAEMKKWEKEMQKWEKGKYALKSIVAEIDTRVVELGSIGGHLLTRLAEKGISYRATSNPIERSIVWTMAVPEEMTQISSEVIEIPYVVIIYEAEEFCNLIMNDALMDHVSRVQSHYPHHTVCYTTNRLMSYINKREQGKYKNPSENHRWKRPPIEEVLSKLTTHFSKVHSRLCVDESELAEHVVGLTCSLASCQFRKKLTKLSVNANGSLVPKDCVDKNLIKKNTWLKALVAIPKVQPRFAIAIWKKYPTMRSLLSVYMDPSKTVHEKEFLLKDLMTEGLLGGDRRLGEICSKRVYRILMAQSGNIKTDDVEHGADFFSNFSG